MIAYSVHKLVYVVSIYGHNVSQDTSMSFIALWAISDVSIHCDTPSQSFRVICAGHTILHIIEVYTTQRHTLFANSNTQVVDFFSYDLGEH